MNRLLGILFMMFHGNLCENAGIDNFTVPKPGFGQFTVNILSVEDCNLTEVIDNMLFNSIKVNAQENSHENDVFNITMNLKKEFKLVKMHSNLSLWKNDKYVKMIEQNTNNPCTHPIGKNFIVPESISNKKECTLKSGKYSSLLKSNSIAHQTLGNQFFYGICKGVMIYYTENGVGFCMISRWVSKPKVQKKINKNSNRNNYKNQ